MNKENIYIDAEDEITAITDKVVGSKASVVALVLPKRCPTLQSAVNLKILNRTADQANKKIVLITSEPAISQLAGLTGMYIAKTLQSKPFIPESQASADSTSGENGTGDGGETAGSGGEEVIEVGDEPKKEEPKVKPAKVAAVTSTKNKNKKMKVPNFDSFRSKLFLIGGGLLLILALWFLFFRVLPKANISIISKTEPLEISSPITADPNATSDNIDQKTFVLKTNTVEKSDSKTAPATGERNDGTKASGRITVYNCDYPDGFTIPAGAVFTTSFSGGTASFVASDSVNVPEFRGSSSSCRISGNFQGAGRATVNVTATRPGAAYNLSSGRTFSVPEVSSGAKVTAIGDSMGGGQDKITKIVSQADCDKAKTDVQSSIGGEDYQKQLIGEFEKEGIFPSTDTFSSKTISVACNPAVDSAASNVTATAKMQFTMSGVDSKSLNELVQKLALEKAGSNQTVIDTGISNATLTIQQTKSNGQVNFNLTSTAKVGIKQDSQAIAESVKGKNARQTADTIRAINGVQDVKVSYSPFWVSKTPKNTKKINIQFVNEDKN